jgi:hypothetical protein
MSHEIDLVIAVSTTPATIAKGRAMAATRRDQLVASVQLMRIIRASQVAP